MNTLYRPATSAALALLLMAGPALAGPGAHGPNGEHLDAPATMQAGPALPRLMARTETFELVAELRSNGLVIMVDRYDTNEPVLGAQLEVESGDVKAAATFGAEQGDYVVTDTTLLKALAAPGEHGLVFTLIAGSQSDLLDGTLVSVAAQDDDGQARGRATERTAWIGGGLAALGLLGSLFWWRLRRSSGGNAQRNP